MQVFHILIGLRFIIVRYCSNNNHLDKNNYNENKNHGHPIITINYNYPT